MLRLGFAYELGCVVTCFAVFLLFGRVHSLSARVDRKMKYGFMKNMVFMFDLNFIGGSLRNVVFRCLFVVSCFDFLLSARVGPKIDMFFNVFCLFFAST